jgi:hypothetical protein
MKLRYDPYQVFRFSKTPAGLYARQKWIGEAETPQWKTDFQKTVTALWADQLPHGSWHKKTVATVRHLFGLHLTVRSSSVQIDAALTWLLKKIDFQAEEIRTRTEDVAAGADLRGLPFIPSRPDMFLIGATLFLATIFGRGNDSDVLAIYQWIAAHGIKNKGRWFDKASSHNVVRAMVVHPIFAQNPATAKYVTLLTDLKTNSGDWGNDLPFYQTLNALAHLDLPGADLQIEQAFNRLAENQNEDGTWSRSEPEWNTFLSIHALRNKGLL